MHKRSYWLLGILAALCLLALAIFAMYRDTKVQYIDVMEDINITTLLAPTQKIGESTFAAPHAGAKAFLEYQREMERRTRQPVKLTVGHKEWNAEFNQKQNQLEGDFVDGIASGDVNVVNVVNDLLKKHKFTIKLEKSINPGAAYACGIIDILVHWTKQGIPTKRRVLNDTKTHDFISLPPKACFEYTENGVKIPVIELRVSENFSVFIAVTNQVHKDNLIDLQHWAQAASDHKQHNNKFEYVELPCVNFNKSGDIEDLLNVNLISNDRNFTSKNLLPDMITQAKFQGILKLNRAGTRAKAAIAIRGDVTSAGDSRPTVTVKHPNLIFDRDFIIWFEQKDIVYFAAHIYPDAMATPLDLE